MSAPANVITWVRPASSAQECASDGTLFYDDNLHGCTTGDYNYVGTAVGAVPQKQAEGDATPPAGYTESEYSADFGAYLSYPITGSLCQPDPANADSADWGDPERQFNIIFFTWLTHRCRVKNDWSAIYKGACQPTGDDCSCMCDEDGYCGPTNGVPSVTFLAYHKDPLGQPGCLGIRGADGQNIYATLNSLGGAQCGADTYSARCFDTGDDTPAHPTDPCDIWWCVDPGGIGPSFCLQYAEAPLETLKKNHWQSWWWDPQSALQTTMCAVNLWSTLSSAPNNKHILCALFSFSSEQLANLSNAWPANSTETFPLNYRLSKCFPPLNSYPLENNSQPEAGVLYCAYLDQDAHLMSGVARVTDAKWVITMDHFVQMPQFQDALVEFFTYFPYWSKILCMAPIPGFDPSGGTPPGALDSIVSYLFKNTDATTVRQCNYPAGPVPADLTNYIGYDQANSNKIDYCDAFSTEYCAAAAFGDNAATNCVECACSDTFPFTEKDSVMGGVWNSALRGNQLNVPRECVITQCALNGQHAYKRWCETATIKDSWKGLGVIDVGTDCPSWCGAINADSGTGGVSVGNNVTQVVHCDKDSTTFSTQRVCVLTGPPAGAGPGTCGASGSQMGNGAECAYKCHDGTMAHVKCDTSQGLTMTPCPTPPAPASWYAGAAGCAAASSQQFPFWSFDPDASPTSTAQKDSLDACKQVCDADVTCQAFLMPGPGTCNLYQDMKGTRINATPWCATGDGHTFQGNVKSDAEDFSIKTLNQPKTPPSPPTPSTPPTPAPPSPPTPAPPSPPTPSASGQCTCANGTPDTTCDASGVERCTSCDAPYRLDPVSKRCVKHDDASRTVLYVCLGVVGVAALLGTCVALARRSRRRRGVNSAKGEKGAQRRKS